MKTDLGVNLGFLKLRNPILTASGTFGYGLEFEPFLDLNELGGFVVKGLYYRPREGNPPPRLVETPMGLINAIGLQGIGAEAFADKILPRLKALKTALIVNVCGETEEEYVRVVEFLGRREGIAAFELNISCPNVQEGGACPAMNTQTTFRLVQAVKKASPIPVITKLSPNVTSIVDIATAAEDAGTDGISLVNTFLAMAIDAETRRPKLANTFGGLSGPAIKPIALRMVYQVASKVRVPVIGMGGISNGQDALEFLIAGARAVEVGTANFVDPGASVRIIHELDGLCARLGIIRIEDAVGTLKTC
jgi:dihydroorotate dehydrogenase (NAD+) catalytic subunit